MQAPLSEDQIEVLKYYRALPRVRQVLFMREIIFLKNTGKIPQRWKSAGFVDDEGGR